METRRMWINGTNGERYVSLPVDVADAMINMSALLLRRERAKDLVDELLRADARGIELINLRQLLIRHGFVDSAERTER